MSVIFKWLAPLWAFIVGFLCLLVATVFFPAINTAATNLQADTAAYSSYYPGFTWVASSTRIIIFVFGVFLILLNVAIIWLKRR